MLIEYFYVHRVEGGGERKFVDPLNWNLMGFIIFKGEKYRKMIF
jgi:hypothetical protein